MIPTQCGKDGNSKQFLFSLCVGKLLCACFMLFAKFTSTVFSTRERLRWSCDSTLQFHWSGHILYLETNRSNSVHQTLSLLLSRRGWHARLVPCIIVCKFIFVNLLLKLKSDTQFTTHCPCIHVSYTARNFQVALAA